MTRPTVLPVTPDAIPTALQFEDRWCVWRYRDEGTRWSKVPRMPTGVYARSNDRSTWVSFAQALAAYQAGGFEGVGFMLGDGWAGIDLDDCDGTDAIVGRLTCYVERSPSGTGYKAVGRSARIGGEIKYTNGARTPWSGARFFAITGHGSGDPLVDITSILDEWFPERRLATALGAVPAYIRVGDTRGTEGIERLTDDQVVQRILETPQAEKFLRLVRGDIAEYGDDHSRADQALCSILAYWCQGDLEQVDRLFRQTRLMRPKWHSASYRRATLAKAVQR